MRRQFNYVFNDFWVALWISGRAKRVLRSQGDSKRTKRKRGKKVKDEREELVIQVVNFWRIRKLKTLKRASLTFRFISSLNKASSVFEKVIFNSLQEYITLFLLHLRFVIFYFSLFLFFWTLPPPSLGEFLKACHNISCSFTLLSIYTFYHPIEILRHSFFEISPTYWIHSLNFFSQTFFPALLKITGTLFT